MAYKIIDPCTGCTACVRPCPVGAISGEKKQIHIIDDRRCIDCGACGLVCTFDALVDGQGNPCTSLPRSAWPKPVFLLDLCSGCTECVRVCPVSCLDLRQVEGRGTTLYPVLARSKACIACGFCADVCALRAVSMKA
jgi:electron transport complex protein RnfB